MVQVGNTKLYSTDDLIEKFNISKGTALKMFKRPDIKTTQIGKWTYIPENTLEKVINNGIKI